MRALFTILLAVLPWMLPSSLASAASHRENRQAASDGWNSAANRPMPDAAELPSEPAVSSDSGSGGLIPTREKAVSTPTPTPGVPVGDWFLPEILLELPPAPTLPQPAVPENDGKRHSRHRNHLEPSGAAPPTGSVYGFLAPDDEAAAATPDRPIKALHSAEPTDPGKNRPELSARSDWETWSAGRSAAWQQQVAQNHAFWNEWDQKNKNAINHFRLNREIRWGQLQTGSADWTDFRQERAREIWDAVRDDRDDLFDDRWWQQHPEAGQAPPTEKHPWWCWQPTRLSKPDGEEELPLGVWALCPEKSGEPVIFLQLAVQKNGQIGGAWTAALTGEAWPIRGSVDNQTRRVTWNLEKTTLETDAVSLTQDVASVLLHFPSGLPQNWLLVRLKDPGFTTATDLEPTSESAAK